MKKTHRFLSLLLCGALLLTLCAPPALAAEDTRTNAVSVWVGGEEMKAEASAAAYATTDEEGKVTIQGGGWQLSDWNIRLEQTDEKIVLTLNGAVIKKTKPFAVNIFSKINAGINYEGSKPLEIRLIGANAVTPVIGESDGNVSAIAAIRTASADLTITNDAADASASLVASCEGAAKDSIVDPYGFYCGGNVTLSGSVTVTAQGGPCMSNSTGFHGNALTVKDDAHLIANSGFTTASSGGNARGVHLTGTLTASGNAKIKASASGNGPCCGIFCTGGAEISGRAQVDVSISSTHQSSGVMLMGSRALHISDNAQWTAKGTLRNMVQVVFSGERFCMDSQTDQDYLSNLNFSVEGGTTYIWRNEEGGEFRALPLSPDANQGTYFEAQTGYTVTLKGTGRGYDAMGTKTLARQPDQDTNLLGEAGSWEHYNFEGWYDNQEGTGEAVTVVVKDDPGNKTFYAKWVPDTYTVTLVTNGGTVQSGNVTSHSYGKDTRLPTNVTKDGYTFGGWYTDKDFNNGPEYTIPQSETGEKTFYAKWLSSDKSITSVAVQGIAGTIQGDIVTVVLPYGSTLPESKDEFAITAAGEVDSLVEQDKGEWRFVVNAADGTRKTYTVCISIGEDPAKENKADIAALLAELKAADWTVEQAAANTREEISAWLNARLKEMDLNGISPDVLVESCTPAIAGDAGNKAGTDGSFEWIITLNKGEGAALATGYVELTGSILAAPFDHAHAWSETWQKNAAHHWHDCTAAGCPVTENSGKEGYAAHALTWENDSGNHWQACAVCGWKGESAAHTYTDDTDTTCDICGYKRTIAPDKPDTPTPTPTPIEPDTPSGPSNPSNPSTPSVPDVPTLEKENWNVVRPVTEDPENPVYTYKDEDGTTATGSRYIESPAGEGRRYLFDEKGVLQTGAAPTPPPSTPSTPSTPPTQSGGSVYVSKDGDVLLNGHLYYLNPERNPADPRTCYAMTDYLRIRPNYAGQTYYNIDGITFAGWIKTADGKLRYQARIEQPGKPYDLYLFVWRAQVLPAGYHPDHPGDPAWVIPAGKYLFDDEGILIEEEGWHACADGKSYYTDASGRILHERVGG